MVSHTEVAAHEPARRILYVVTKASWGGAQRYVFDIASEAKRAGNEVLVVSGAEGDLTKRLREAGIAVSSISSMKRDIGLLAEVSVLRSLFHIVREFRPDIIHGNSSKAGGLAALVGRLAGTPRIVFTAHGWAFNEERPLWQKAGILFFHYITILLSHQTVCVSDALAEDIDWMPFVQSRLRVIQNGIEPGPLVARTEARRRLAPGLSCDLWIGTVAELHPTKQLSVLIRAFAHIQSSYPGTALVLIGDGEERERLSSLIQDMNLSDNVRLCGHIEEASTYLTALDIFALPSRTEGLGYVLLEAGLASLPVVASNVGGIPEIVRDKESGILVPSGDVGALAESLALLLGNEQLRRELGYALHERVIRVFSKDKMLRETFAAYGT